MSQSLISDSDLKPVISDNSQRKESSEKVAIVEGSTKKRKRTSPFRIKQGCVAALRYRPGGNQVSLVREDGTPVSDGVGEDTAIFAEVWAEPQPGHDEGLALVGNRVRCCFPKFVVSDGFQFKAKTRYLDGDVVAVVNYEKQFFAQRKLRRTRQKCGTLVELLIDDDMLENMPFLKRIDKELDTSQMGELARRHYMNERKVRGENKAIVRILLCDTSGIVIKESATSLEAMWVIRKRIKLRREKRRKKSTLSRDAGRSLELTKSLVAKLQNNETSPLEVKLHCEYVTGRTTQKRKRNEMSGGAGVKRYLGDSNDTILQQEANWRWQASRVQFPFCPPAHDSSRHEVFNLIGEVVSLRQSTVPNGPLAFAMIRRLFLPEHTQNGRLPHHGVTEAFDDIDSPKCRSDLSEDEPNFCATPIYYLVAVEDLVLVRRHLVRDSQNNGKTPDSNSHSQRERMHEGELCISLGYSMSTNSFVNIGMSESHTQGICRRCRRVLGPLSAFADKTASTHLTLCRFCTNVLALHTPTTRPLPKVVMANCNHAECDQKSEISLESAFSPTDQEIAAGFRGTKCFGRIGDGNPFSSTRSAAKHMGPVSFGFCKRHCYKLSGVSAPKPVADKTHRRARLQRDSTRNSLRKKELVSSNILNDAVYGHRTEDLAQKFSPSSCRTVPYNIAVRTFEFEGKLVANQRSAPLRSEDKPRNMRLVESFQVRTNDLDKDDRWNTRAVRANQRRLLRDVASIGVSVDTLSGKEQLLRFGRSNIHAWGVFADEEIKEGELLVEYRGELVGNSIAEKRELEYETAKIGSDYMFRVDAHTVCDATKHGNVARFVNHSCDGNCYTKVISVDGTKRIVVYAKRDIRPGEELCYDYKFPLEFDKTKRIPCQCGTSDCRGFMNWDKRYTTLEKSNETVESTEKSYEVARKHPNGKHEGACKDL